MKKLILYKPLYPFTISQGFGQNLSPLYAKLGMKGHNGLDCIRGCIGGKCYATDGSNVRAAHDGEVMYAGRDSCEGYGIVIRTLETFDFENKPTFFKTIYWHLKPDIPVRVGQKVKIGDVLGLADNTGCSSGSHLHFGLKPIAEGENEWTWMNINQDNGYFGAIDPLPYLDGKSAYEMRSTLDQIQKKVIEIAKLIANLVNIFKK